MRNLQLSAYSLSSCLGHGIDQHRDALVAERGGLRSCDFDEIDLETWVGRVDGVENNPIPARFRDYECRNNRLAYMALNGDGFADQVNRAKSRYGATRIGIFIGTSTSGIQEAELAYQHRDPVSRNLPQDFRYNTTHTMFSVGDFSRRILGLEGPAQVVSTACSSSAKVFAVAHRFMSAGYCDAAVVGGVDSLCQMTIYGFNSLQLVSQQRCRPCDTDRNGLNIGEAAGFALLEWDNEKAGVCLLGFGESSDAYHMSAPHPEGAGAARAIRAALDCAGLKPTDIDYINLHGTGTQANDLAEDKAVHSIFHGRVPCSSTKGFTGHALGAAGIVEALFSYLAAKHGVAYRSLNTVNVDEKIRSPILVETRRTTLTRVMSNSFGFGGDNVCLIFGSPS